MPMLVKKEDRPAAEPVRPTLAKKGLALAVSLEEEVEDLPFESTFTRAEAKRMISFLEQDQANIPKKAEVVSLVPQRVDSPHGTDVEPRPVAHLVPGATDDSEEYFRWQASYSKIPHNYVLLADKESHIKRRNDGLTMRKKKRTSHSKPDWDYKAIDPYDWWPFTQRPPTVDELFSTTKKQAVHARISRAQRVGAIQARIKELKFTIIYKPVNDPVHGETDGNLVDQWYLRDPRDEAERRLTSWLISHSPEHGDPRAGITRLLEDVQWSAQARSNIDEARYVLWQSKFSKPSTYFFHADRRRKPRTRFETKCNAFALHIDRLDWNRNDAVQLTHTLRQHMFCPKPPKPVAKKLGQSFQLVGKPYGGPSKEEQRDLVRQANANSSAAYMQYLAATYVPYVPKVDPNKGKTFAYLGEKRARPTHDDLAAKLAVTLTDSLLSEERVRQLIADEMDQQFCLIMSEVHATLTDTAERVFDAAVEAADKYYGKSIREPQFRDNSKYVERNGILLPDKWFK